MKNLEQRLKQFHPYAVCSYVRQGDKDSLSLKGISVNISWVKIFTYFYGDYENGMMFSPKIFLKKIGKKIALEFGRLLLSLVQYGQKLYLSLEAKSILLYENLRMNDPYLFNLSLY